MKLTVTIEGVPSGEAATIEDGNLITIGRSVAAQLSIYGNELNDMPVLSPDGSYSLRRSSGGGRHVYGTDTDLSDVTDHRPFEGAGNFSAGEPVWRVNAGGLALLARELAHVIALAANKVRLD